MAKRRHRPHKSGARTSPLSVSARASALHVEVAHPSREGGGPAFTALWRPQPDGPSPRLGTRQNQPDEADVSERPEIPRDTCCSTSRWRKSSRRHRSTCQPTEIGGWRSTESFAIGMSGHGERRSANPLIDLCVTRLGSRFVTNRGTLEGPVGLVGAGYIGHLF